MECYHRSQRPDWPWFESRMTYANAVLPHALFVAARALAERGISRRRGSHRSPSSTGVTTVRQRLLARSATAIGIRTARKSRSTTSNRWRPPRWPTPRWPRLRAAGDEKYLATFRRAHGWFHGQNSLEQPLADAQRGACCDGLQPSGVNRNQGAESTLAYLWTELHNSELQQALGDDQAAAAARNAR